MNELIERLAANVGVDQASAETALGIILDFLAKEGPPEKVQTLIERMPGADQLIAATREAEGGGGLFGGMGGVMGAGSRMMAAGLNMGQIQGITRETIGYARERAGEDVVGDIVASIPGLDQFV
jgi:hypothetical protein